MTSSPWGYERPDCIGNHALALFIDDIQRVLDAYANTQGSTDARLFQVQAEANRLLQGYAEHARGTTVFLTTQTLEEAEHLADRIAILHEGRIIANGTLDELKQLFPPAKVEYIEKQPTLEEIFLAVIGKQEEIA